MRIALVGGSGFLGSKFSDYLLANTNHQIISISHSGNNSENENKRLITKQADVMDEEQMTSALQGVEVAFYFIHLMGESRKGFLKQESMAAKNFANACHKSKVARVVYMSGLGSDTKHLSEHLESRHRTGEIMRQMLPLVIEFRASMIIGKGSISFDIISNLVNKLLIMILPAWSSTSMQPIAEADVLKYLAASITVDLNSSQIIDIVGRDVITYKQLYKKYAEFINKRIIFIPLPLIPPWLSGWWLNLFTPNQHAHIGRAMIDSLSTPMVVSSNLAKKYFGKIEPVDLITAFAQAE